MSQHKLNQFNIKDTLQTAWKLLKGSKLSININYLAILAIFIVIYFFLNTIFGKYTQAITAAAARSFFYYLILKSLSLLYLILMAPFIAGIYMCSIKRARGKTLTINSGLHYFNYWLSSATTLILVVIVTVILSGVFQFILTLITTLLLKIIPTYLIKITFILIYTVSIFLSLAINALFIFSIPTLIDQHNKPWSAISASIRLVWPHWLRIIGLMAVLLALGMIALLPFTAATDLLNLVGVTIATIIITILALSYYLPFISLCLGVAYHQLADGR